FEGHENHVIALTLTPDGRTLFSGGDDRIIRVWDVATAREVRVIGPLKAQVSGIALSPNGKVMASCSGDDFWGENVIHLWDVGTGKEICLGSGHQRRVLVTGLAADGRAVVSVSNDGTIRKWDAGTGEELGHIDDSFPMEATLSPEARIAAV